MESILFVITGIIVGALIGWLLAKSGMAAAIQKEKDGWQEKYGLLELEMTRLHKRCF
jgi:hypothetical protein